MLEVNSEAPLQIEVIDESLKTVSLKKKLGKYVVLYFYPKDNTPGCTTEACEFRDANRDLQELGVEVIGVSKDSVASHQKFKEKHHLNFELWSDPEHKLLEAFGAWGEKKRFGKIFMGVKRSTFIINPKGTIVKVWKNVRAKGHAEKVLEFLQKEIKQK